MRQHEAEQLDANHILGLARTGFAHSYLTDNGYVICILGIADIRPGVSIVYLVPSKLFRRYAKSAIKALLEYRDVWIETRNPHRIETASLANDETDRWMEYLGFECEGTLRQFTSDRLDYKMWAIVREPNG